uniref:Vacuolar ATPase assembly protein VMA22 n=1 Tax=Zosterops lateralis melanops TaxID=1220523 RepID=A0A8D2PJY0_ZOSLA
SPPGSLSLSLDEAALEVMEALELLRERRERLEQHLRQGWLSLAQARYSLGCHRVSSLQYGATMVPRVRVCHRWGHGDTGETLEGTLGQWEGRDAPTLRRCLEQGGTPRTPTPSRRGVTVRGGLSGSWGSPKCPSECWGTDWGFWGCHPWVLGGTGEEQGGIWGPGEF